jgi:hypothetical protein
MGCIVMEFLPLPSVCFSAEGKVLRHGEGCRQIGIKKRNSIYVVSVSRTKYIEDFNIFRFSAYMF